MAATFPGGVLIQEDSAPHVEPLQVDGDTAEVRVHAVGPCRFRWQGPDAGRFRAVALDGAELRAGREGDAWTVDVDAGARTCLRMRLAW